jgi:hypothetical protein
MVEDTLVYAVVIGVERQKSIFLPLWGGEIMRYRSARTVIFLFYGT